MRINDFSRQMGWFDPKSFNTPVHVIGAGATGSQIVYQLVKMGVRDITVYDFDIIEEHNIANQLYGIHDVGMYKVDALSKRLLSDTGVDIKTVNKKVDKTFKDQLEGIVFVLTDTMASRKEIYDHCLKHNPRVELVIETRMSIQFGRIYTFNPMIPKETLAYGRTLYDDDVAETSFCGSSLSIIPTAVGISAFAVWGVIKHHLEQEQINELLYDYTSGTSLATTW